MNQSPRIRPVSTKEYGGGSVPYILGIQQVVKFTVVKSIQFAFYKAYVQEENVNDKVGATLTFEQGNAGKLILLTGSITVIH